MTTVSFALFFSLVAIGALSFKPVESVETFDEDATERPLYLDALSPEWEEMVKRPMRGLDRLPPPWVLARQTRSMLPYLPWIREQDAVDFDIAKRNNRNRLNLLWMRQHRSGTRPHGRVVMNVDRKKVGRNRPYH